MGYKIVYGEESRNVKTASFFSGRLRLLTAVFILLFVLSVRLLWNDGADALRSWLIPGEPAVTETAVSGLINDLRGGVELGEAVTAFCREIIAGAQLG